MIIGPGIVTTLVIGVAAGWLSGQIMKGGSFGLIPNLIVGLVGSVIGSILFHLVGLSGYGLIGNLIVSTVGAIALLYGLKVLKV